MQNKRGLSDLVSNVLIILLVFASIAIMGVIILNLVKLSGDSIESAAACKLINVKPVQCIHNITDANLLFSTEYETGINITSVDIVSLFNDGTESKQTWEGSNFGNFETQSVRESSGENNYDQFYTVTTFKDKKGVERSCVSDKIGCELYNPDSEYIDPVDNPNVCGSAATGYLSSQGSFGANPEFCKGGEPNLIPTFPVQGGSSTWVCSGETCRATRNPAASSGGGGGGGGGGGSNGNNNLPEVTIGTCGISANTCNAGTFLDIIDNSTDYLWRCIGTAGNASCNKPLSSPVNGVCGPTPYLCQTPTFATDKSATHNYTHNIFNYSWICPGSSGGASAKCNVITDYIALESCNNNLDRAYETYKLINDVTGATGNCFVIAAPGITLDGNDHIIAGSGAGTGIDLGGSWGNLYIKNFKDISKFQTGILGIAGGSATLINVTADNSTLTKGFSQPAGVMNGLKFVDSKIGRYGFTSTSFLTIENTKYGRILAIYGLHGDDYGYGLTSLTPIVSINNNSIYVKPGVPNINNTLDLAFYGMQGITNPRVMKDGVECTDCTMNRDLNGNINVHVLKGGGTYSIVEQSPVNNQCTNPTDLVKEYNVRGDVVDGYKLTWTSKSGCYYKVYATDSPINLYPFAVTQALAGNGTLYQTVVTFANIYQASNFEVRAYNTSKPAGDAGDIMSFNNQQVSNPSITPAGNVESNKAYSGPVGYYWLNSDDLMGGFIFDIYAYYDYNSTTPRIYSRPVQLQFDLYPYQAISPNPNGWVNLTWEEIGLPNGDGPTGYLVVLRTDMRQGYYNSYLKYVTDTQFYYTGDNMDYNYPLPSTLARAVRVSLQ